MNEDVYPIQNEDVPSIQPYYISFPECFFPVKHLWKLSFDSISMDFLGAKLAGARDDVYIRNGKYVVVQENRKQRRI